MSERASRRERPARFAVFFDGSKTTSGQRFYRDLRDTLAGRSVGLDEDPDVVLFNVSAPIAAMRREKRRGRRIVLRLDGLYCDRLSPAFVASLPVWLRPIGHLGMRVRGLHDHCAFVANLYDRNYGSFARIAIADAVIYQSGYAKRVHDRFFARKPSAVIVNGSRQAPPPTPQETSSQIRVVTIADDWRASKRLLDLVRFLEWARDVRGANVTLTILGYAGRVAPCDAEWLKQKIETAEWITALPRFTEFDGAFAEALHRGDIYMTFTFRDSCPNTVVESMAHGLPVVAVGSGGLPDIVGDAGVLAPADDFADGFYMPARYEGVFPSLDRDAILNALLDVHRRLPEFRERVTRRFAEVLDIERVADRYAEVLAAC